jgi:anti-sigma factor RsiW
MAPRSTGISPVICSSDSSPEEVNVMGCRGWEAELTDWALDELSPTKAKQLEQHIGQCEECARSAQSLRGVRQALMSSLTDREMPAHLVLVGEKPRSLFAGFWTALFRTAALSAAAAAIFVVVASVGFRYGGSRLLPTTARVEPTMTRTELQAYVAQVVAEQASLQRKETQAATVDLAASLSAEQMRIQQQLQYLELAQNTVYKETQRQNAVIGLVAHNQLQPPTSSSGER